MHTSPAVRGVTCNDCDATFDPADATGRCPDCDGSLAVEYDHDAVAASRETLADERFEGVARYADLLPFDRDALVTMDEGATPLVESPRLADELGVAEVYVKDEGANPTGSVADRGLALAVTAAREAGADAVSLPTPGPGGQSAAAYAARAGLASHSFVPSRTPFETKAMINVHGGEMNVVGGRYGDAVDAFEDTVADEPWHSLAAFDQPYRREGAKTLAYELAEQLDWSAPDAVVYPTGEGVGLTGVHRGMADLQKLGLIEDAPALYAAQAADCAPIAEAFETGEDDTDLWERPDTICGGVEVADPAGGAAVLDAIRATDGGAVATDDSDILDSAVTIAQAEGVEMAASAGPAASGAWELSESEAFDADDTVVLVNTLAGGVEADLLRSHLMSKGI